MKKRMLNILTMCLLFVVLLCGCKKEDKKTTEFKAPENYASVVQVKINPTVNLYLDDEETILAVEYVNKDAKECYSQVESKLVGSKLEKGVNMVLETAESEGYLEDNKEVTIDVIQVKQEDEKLEILTVATESAEKFIAEKKIDAEVVLTESTQKEVDDKIAAEKAAAEKAAAEKAAAEKAAAEKAKKNPITNLKKDVEYWIVKPDAEGIMLTGIFIKFKSNGEYSYAMVPYSQDDYGQGESIVYNGKTYYEAGGGGGGGTYTLTEEKIIMADAYDMVLTMTTDGKLVVEKADSTSDFFKVGDTLTLK